MAEIAIAVGTALANSLPYIATAAVIGGATTAAVTGTVGAVEQHKQAEANAKAQEAQLNYNKRLEEREAARIEAETAENARRQREAAEQLKAQQRALLGKSGAAITSGSPLAVLGETAADEEMKVQDIHASGYSQAMQHREQAKMFGYQAGVARASAPSKAALGANIAGTWGNYGLTMGNLTINTASALSKVSK